MISLDVVLTACMLVNAAGLAAAAIALHRPGVRRGGPRALSFAVGVLLGAVLLDLLPHLWEATGHTASLLGLLAAALLASRLFDRACACGHRARESHPADRTPLLLAGDFVHSMVDGALVVAALAVGVVPGAVATMAVAMHEVPRRVAIVALLVRSGRRPAAALALGVGTGLGTLVGATLAWHAAEAVRLALPAALALSAAAMLYVALSQSARIVDSWRGRRLTLDCGLLFGAGLTMAGASHQLMTLAG